MGRLLVAVCLAGLALMVGAQAALAAPPNTAFRYDYDAAGHLKAVVKPSSETALYSWDVVGDLTSLALSPSSRLSIVQLTPAQGQVGSAVTISGTGFSPEASADTVKFNGRAATVTAASEWSLSVTVPTGATTGTVTVQTHTEGPVTSAQTFTVGGPSAPSVSSLSASLVAAGSEVTVSGSGFEANANGDVVAVNRALPRLVTESASAIKFKLPPAESGGHVSVATPQGFSTGPDLFVAPSGTAVSSVAATERFSVGGSTTMHIASPGKVGLAMFDVAPGQNLSLVLSEATMSGHVSVWGPEGGKIVESEVRFPGGETTAEHFALHGGGTYTLLVSPEGSSTGSVKIAAVGDVMGSLVPSTEGAQKPVSLGTPYEQAEYSILGRAGETVSVALSNVSFPSGSARVQMLNMFGQVLGEATVNGTNGAFMTQVKFPSTAIYTLAVVPNLASTGSFTLTAYEDPDVTGTITPSAEGESKTVTTTIPGQYARITFAGTEGERVSLVSSEASDNGIVSILAPSGAEVGRQTFREGYSEFLSPVTLPSTGTYTILVAPSEAQTGHVKITAYSVVDVTGPIVPTTSGAVKAVTITTPGQKALYTVAGSAGEIVSVRLSGVSFLSGSATVEWLNPEGQIIREAGISGTSEQFMTQVKFPTTGTYTLEVNPYQASTGSVTLTAYEAPDVTGTITPTSEGETKTFTTTVPGQYARIAFSGSGGQTVTLKIAESTIRYGWASVLNAEGSEVSGTRARINEGQARIEVSLPATGTYTLLVEPEGTETGSLKVTAYLGSHPGPLRIHPGTTQPALATPSGTPPAHSGLVGFAAVLPTAPAGSTQAPPSAAKGASHAHRGSPRARGRFSVAAPGGSALALSSFRRATRGFRAVGLGSWNPPQAGQRGPSGAWEALEPSTPWTGAPSLSAAAGSTALAGQVLALDGLPLAGVRVAVEGTYVAGLTDSSGRFLLSGLPAGRQILVVEGNSLKGAQQYGIYEIGVNLAANVTTTLDYTIWLTPLDRAGDQHVESPTTHAVRVTNPKIPGLEVRLPAGSVITDSNGKVVRKLNLTAIPTDRPPFPLPAFVSVPVYFTVQPGRAYLSKGAQIVYPNWGHLPPGERVAFWNYEADKRGWYVYGHGTVTPDGKQVMPDPGVRVWELSGAMITNEGNPPGRGPKPGGKHGGDPVDLRTGLLVYQKRELTIPDTIPIVIEHVYRQSDSNSYSFGIGTASAYEMRLWSENNYHEADLVLPNGGRVHYVRTSPGEGFTEAVYEAKTTLGAFYASTLRWNNSDHGWDLTLTNGLTYVFGEFAPLQAIRDRYNNQLTITRTNGQTGNITQITSPHGRWVTFTYDASNRITEVTDNTGRQLKYVYEAGLLKTATDAAGRITKYEYTAANQLKAVTDPRGKKYLETEYDTHERVSKQTLGDTGTYNFSYALNGEAVESATVTDPRGLQNKSTFNSEGFLTSQINALGTSIAQTTSYERQAGSGLLLSVTDSRARKTSYQHDSLGNITKMTRLAGTSSERSTSYAYEPLTNEPTSYTDALEHTTRYQWGTSGELLSVTDPLGHKRSYEYNPEGQPTSITNAVGKTTRLAYENGALTTVTDPLGRRTTRFVDTAGRVEALTSPGGQRTSYENNADNQVTKITDPLGKATSYEYDADGDLTKTTDPLTHKSTAAYDPMDRLETETDALEHSTKAIYDKDGNLTQITDRRGKINKFIYDSLNRLSEAKYGVSGETAESTIVYTYDNANRLSKIVDSATGTYTPGYDEFDRLTSLATPQGTVSYGYDEADRRTSMTVPGQEPVRYSYDEANRLKEITRATQAVSFGYDNANRVTSKKLVDGVEQQYGYDEANELTSILYKKGESTLGELDYSYDPNSRREATWGSYARTGLPEAVSSATYNADNEMTARNGQTYGYDANGNLTSALSSEYKWNARNQLTTITGTISASFAYDPFGRRTSKTIAGTNTKVLYDGPNAVQETQGSNTTNLLTGLNTDETYARTTSTSTENLLTDGLNSTLGLAGSTGTVTTSYTYDAFGNTTQEGTASTNPFQYTGREYDGHALYYNRARYYNPTLERFLSQDPLGQEANGPNLYLYTLDSPLNAIDLYGTMSLRGPVEEVGPSYPPPAPSPGGPGQGPGGPGGPGAAPGAGGSGSPGPASGYPGGPGGDPFSHGGHDSLNGLEGLEENNCKVGELKIGPHCYPEPPEAHEPPEPPHIKFPPPSPPLIPLPPWLRPVEEPIPVFL